MNIKAITITLAAVLMASCTSTAQPPVHEVIGTQLAKHLMTFSGDMDESKGSISGNQLCLNGNCYDAISDTLCSKYLIDSKTFGAMTFEVYAYSFATVEDAAAYAEYKGWTHAHNPDVESK